MSSYQPFQITTESKLRNRNIVATIFVMMGAVLLAIFLNLFVFQSYFVDGESMSPTLHSDDRLIVSKVERSLSQLTSKDYIPNRGDIVVINGAASPTTQVDAPELIKRVVAVPGDTIRIDNGKVYVSNATEGTFDVDKELKLDVAPTDGENISVTVTEGKVFVLGDNRARGGSLDSRVFGLVDTKYIDGRLWARIMPISGGRVF